LEVIQFETKYLSMPGFCQGQTRHLTSDQSDMKLCTLKKIFYLGIKSLVWRKRCSWS